MIHVDGPGLEDCFGVDIAERTGDEGALLV
jgi:hypothetical protein